MNAFSCIINFNADFTKESPKYIAMLSEMSHGGYSEYRIEEHSAFCCETPHKIISKISEGYQFTALFCGSLRKKALLRKLLAEYGLISADDAELALTAYIHCGEKCTEVLHGAFCMIVYDFMRRSAFAYSSPAYSPIFYRTDGDTALLSSAPSAFFFRPDFVPKITADELRRIFLIPKYPSGCPFYGMQCLAPGETLVLRSDGAKLLPPRKTSVTLPIGLNETAQSVAEIIAGNTEKSDEGGMILNGTHADSAVFSAITAKVRQIMTYSFHGENLLTQAFNSFHSHLPLTENDLFYALDKSVSACGMPIFSYRDYLLPIYFTRMPKTHGAVYSAEMPLHQQYMYGVFEKAHLLLPEIVRSLNLSDAEKPSAHAWNYAPMLAHACGIRLISPAWDARIAKILRNVPYSPENVCAEILRQKPGIVPLAQKPCDDLPLLKRILLDILADANSPINAFFSKNALLRLCEGTHAFSENESAFIAYIIKLNMWFAKYKPRII